MEQLKLLMDYTRFHIGVYLTLGAAAIGLLEARLFCASVLLPGLALLFVAGIAGGVIGSSIPDFATWTAFDCSKLKVLGIRTWSWRRWAMVEHLSFWLAIGITTFLVILE